MLIVFLVLAGLVYFLVPKGFEGIDNPISKASDTSSTTTDTSGAYTISETVTESTWTWRIVIVMALILVGIFADIGRK